MTTTACDRCAGRTPYFKAPETVPNPDRIFQPYDQYTAAASATAKVPFGFNPRAKAASIEVAR